MINITNFKNDNTISVDDVNKGTDANGNKANKIVIDVTFKADDDKSGNENIIVEDGFIKATSGESEEITLREQDFYYILWMCLTWLNLNQRKAIIQ